MPAKNPISSDELDELESLREVIAELRDGFDEALDPELTREELVAKVKDLAELLPDDDEDDDEDGGEDDGEDGD